jgi:hypothetical protein
MPASIRERRERERQPSAHAAPLPGAALDARTIHVLARLEGLPIVSITLPTHRSGARQEDRIRLKNALHAAHVQLTAAIGAKPAAAILAPLDDRCADEGFWAQPGAGLALFAAPGHACHMWSPRALPELVVAGRHAHLKSLMPVVQGDGAFHCLALTRGDALLYAGNRQGMHAVALPADVAPAAPGHGAEHHSGMRSIHAGGAGHGTARHFGTADGATASAEEEALHRYLRHVDQRVLASLHHAEEPLVLAGEEGLLNAFRSVTRLRVHPAQLPGNPGGRSQDDLHRAAWTLVAPRFAQSAAEARERYLRLLGSPAASDDLVEVLAAAARGRISHLLVAGDAERWGGCDRASGAVVEHDLRQPGDEDLLNLALVLALGTHAEVHVLDRDAIPSAQGIAATMHH